MLVDEHADGDAAGVKAVQEVLDVVVGRSVLLAEGIFVLDHSLSHGGDHLVVAVPDDLQNLHKPGEKGEWRRISKFRLETQIRENNVILSSSAHVFVLHLRFEDSLVIRVLVQELQDLH